MTAFGVSSDLPIFHLCLLPKRPKLATQVNTNIQEGAEWNKSISLGDHLSATRTHRHGQHQALQAQCAANASGTGLEPCSTKPETKPSARASALADAHHYHSPKSTARIIRRSERPN